MEELGERKKMEERESDGKKRHTVQLKNQYIKTTHNVLLFSVS